MVHALLPLFRGALALFGSDFSVLALAVNTTDGRDVLHLRADLAHTVIIANQPVYPLRWNPQGAGWLDVRLTLGGVLLYPLLLLIVVLAWPVRGIREMLWRCALSVPLIVLLLLTTTLTQLAELWFPIHDELDPHSIWPLLLASRLLMGGGGLLLALVAGLAVVAVARHYSAEP